MTSLLLLLLFSFVSKSLFIYLCLYILFFRYVNPFPDGWPHLTKSSFPHACNLLWISHLRYHIILYTLSLHYSVLLSYITLFTFLNMVTLFLMGDHTLPNHQFLMLAGFLVQLCFLACWPFSQLTQSSIPHACSSINFFNHVFRHVEPFPDGTTSSICLVLKNGLLEQLHHFLYHCIYFFYPSVDKS